MNKSTFRFGVRFALLLVTVVLFSAAAATADENPVGTWNLKLEFRGRQVDVTLTIEKGDDDYSGTWEGARGSTELSDLKYEGNKLTWVRKVERQGQEFSIDYEATIAGDSLEGKMITPRGENTFSGKRAE